MRLYTIHYNFCTDCPLEIAQNFKEQGNDYFKGKRYREASGFYTQGIDATPTDKVLLEALLCNRAACNLELRELIFPLCLCSICTYPYRKENYGSVLRDCSKALTLNNNSSKSYYRSALALTSLSRYEEALDCCSRCLAYDADNTGVKAVQVRAAKLKREADIREQKKQEEKRKEDEKKMVLKMALRVIQFVSPFRYISAHHCCCRAVTFSSSTSLVVP